METRVPFGAEPPASPPPRPEALGFRGTPHPPGGAPAAKSEGDFSRGVRWSFGIHAAILSIILVKSLVFPGEPMPYVPTLRVDIVGLPDLLKKDMAQLHSAPPPTAGEPAKSEEAPSEPAPPAPKAKTKAEAPVDTGEMVLKPKKSEAKAQREAPPAPSAKDRQKKLKSALARIKALDKIMGDPSLKDTPRAASGPLIKGNAISRGTSLSGDARESAVASYYDLMRDRLQENWTLPVWIARQNYSARVQVFIDARGALKGFRFTKSSGNAQFDDAIKRTLQQSQPFPTPPDNIASTLLVDGVLVGFPL